MPEELTGREEVKLLVDAFYDKVKQDPLLSGVFNEVIGNHWPEHLEKMYDFWQTVLFGEMAYKGSPFSKHINLPVAEAHFEQWLKLFGETLNELFSGEKAEEAKWRAGKMAEMFQQRIAYHRSNPGKLIH